MCESSERVHIANIGVTFITAHISYVSALESVPSTMAQQGIENTNRVGDRAEGLQGWELERNHQFHLFDACQGKCGGMDGPTAKVEGEDRRGLENKFWLTRDVPFQHKPVYTITVKPVFRGKHNSSCCVVP